MTSNNTKTFLASLKLQDKFDFEDVILNDFHALDSAMSISQENEPIIFKKYRIKNLSLSLSSDIIFEQCSFDSLYLDSSFYDRNRSIKFVDCVGYSEPSQIQKIKIVSSNNIDIENSKIKLLKLGQNNDKGFARFKKCKIDILEGDSNYNNTWSTYFDKCEFTEIKNIKHINFDIDTEFINCKFNKTTDVDIFRELKKMFQSHHNDFLTNLFGAYEIKAKYQNMDIRKETGDKIFGFLYSKINDFGIAPYRPIKYLIVSCIMFATILHLEKNQVILKNVLVFAFGPFKYLLVNFKFSGNLYEYSMAFMTVYSSILWFFLILGIRKRFKIEK